MQKTLFDEIEPFNVGHLSSKDGHDVYFEESGNPSGQPIIFLHGGPGGGTGPKQRRFLIRNITELFFLIKEVAAKASLWARLKIIQRNT